MKIFSSCLIFDPSLVEFSPNEPGIPFGDNLAHQVGRICRQFGDSKNPALPSIRLMPVTNSRIYEVEVMEKGGALIHLSARCLVK